MYVREFNGSAWQDMAWAPMARKGVSDSTGDHRAQLAYVDGTLVAVWQHMLDGYQNLHGKSFDGAAWADLGALTPHGPATDNATIARDVRLASGGGVLWMFWTDEDTRRSDQPQALYAERWNGTTFVARLPGDAAGDGISETGGRLSGAVAVGVTVASGPGTRWWPGAKPTVDSAVTRRRRRSICAPTCRHGIALPWRPTSEQLQTILATQDLGAGDCHPARSRQRFAGFTVTSGRRLV